MKQTPNYQLQLYELNDAANLTDGYNNSMLTLDDVIKSNKDEIDAKFPITSSNIEDGTILTTDISNGAITNNKLSSDAVTSDKIENGAVGTAELADKSVTSAKIADETITSSNIEDGAITSDKIADNTIVAGDIADKTITADKLADGVIPDVDFNNIPDGTITLDMIADSAIDTTPTDGSENLVDSNGIYDFVKAEVDSVSVKPNSITTDMLQNGAVTAAKLADGAVNFSQIPANTINSNMIQNKAITADKLADGVLDTKKNTVICIGDSWTMPTDSWAHYLQSSYGYDTKIYATSGAGYTVSGSGGNTLMQNAQNFINANISANQIKCIIIMGGINDALNSVGFNNVAAAVDTLHTNIRQHYSNTPIFFIINCGKSTLQLCLKYYYMLCNKNYKDYTIFVPSVLWLNYWINGVDRYKSDGIHPNTGEPQRYLAQKVANAINYIPQPVENAEIAVPNYGTVRTRSNGEIFEVNFGGLSGSITTSSSTTGNLWDLGSHAQEFPLRQTFVPFRSGGTGAGVGWIVLNRELPALRIYSATASETVQLSSTAALAQPMCGYPMYT